MDALTGIDEPVPFDAGVADALISACRTAASSVDGQVGERWGFVHTGSTDFKGHFSELFAQNALTAAGDATELSMRLREVADGAEQLKEEARKEQQRRDTAKAWKKEHDERSNLDKIGDFFSGGDDPPVGPPASPVSIAVSPASSQARQPLAPSGASGGSGGGTSSARPSNLEKFASGSKGANDLLRPVPARLESAYTDFKMKCQWGTLSADGVFLGFRQWLTANDNDVHWATAVANAFTAAGGDGKVSTLSNSAVQAALKAANVDASRKDLTIAPPQAFGAPPTTGYADDPVNTATGNFLEVETDLAFPGAAGSLTLSRCYNSFDRTEHAFGPGWSSICDAGLTFDEADGLARFTLPDGRQIHFPRLGDGWDRAAGENLWLAHDSEDLVVSGNDGSWWRLSSGGTLQSFGAGPESSLSFITLRRDEAGRVERLEHARGQWISLDWDGERVAAAHSADGRSISYVYDPEGRLLSAARPDDVRTYRWNDDGLIAAVVDADGVVEVENVYDTEGRVTSQRSPFGRTTRYVYLPGRTTVVSDEDGTRSNTWLHDARGRLIGVVDADEQRQSTSYDRWGNPVLLTERDGATTVHEYDARGRRGRTVTPSGADLTYGYDDLDRVTTVVTEQGAVTEYTYDSEQRNPSTVLDPEGGLTRLTWTDGLLTEIVDPTDVVVRFSYDSRGDLVGTTDADGHTARLERDTLGRVTAAITPSGHTTTFGWDPATGQLAQRQDPVGAVWRYEYSAAGRLTATTDPMGGRTSVEYGSHGEESATIDPIGRSITRQLDELGNLGSAQLPDGSRWRFTYDALSRLTTTTDPTGGTWSEDYDAAGHLVASTDPTGIRVGVDLDQAAGQVQVRNGDGDAGGSLTQRFDPLGRLTAEGSPGSSAAVYSYDRCGRPVEALDSDGGLTVVARDAAGRPLAVTSPSGATTRYGYDRCGRLTTVTDPLGGTVSIGYDLDGQAVEQTSATGDAARSTYDACGRLVEHTEPGVGTRRWVYDLAGRVVESQDPRMGRRQFQYDAAGQLISATDGNGGVTTWTYDANGRAVRITDPSGGVTSREFDAMNRCILESDPLGRTTRASYDASGRPAWQQSADGHEMTWTYDAYGRPASMAVDGRTVTALTRDLRRRTVRITDTTDPTGRVAEHELEWSPRHQLVRRARDGRAVEWTYDADGNRTSMTTPDGSSTRYGWDAAGRLAWVDHTTLGRAAFDRDAAGRLVSAVAGGLIQSWEHRDGFVVAHTITDGEGATRTEIDRDEQGRIARVSKGDGIDRSVTEYGYDGACQLVESRTRSGIGTATGRWWVYDAAGRLLTETIDDEVRSTRDGRDAGPAVTRHVYDAAGQLLSTLDAKGVRTGYRYDGAGRRVRAESSDGRARDFLWNPTGYLAGIVRHDKDRVRKITVHADALGELASVDGTEFFWDSAAYAGAPVLAGDTPILSTGSATGIGSGWTAPGWRTSRSTGTDPWSLSSSAQGLGAASIGASGEVSVDGLEWMGARVYDPAARGFLSVDPLDPVTGSGWAGNPYAFAGNDPLHGVDPTGLRPVTDAELQSYRDSNGIGGTLKSAASATGHWFKNNWEYVAGGAMVVAGGALMITGVGGPAGAMLVSAGADTIIQKATTGEVNWGQVAVSGASGLVGFGAGGLLAKTAMSAGAKEVAANVAEGVVSNGAGYLTGPGPHTAGGLLKSSTVGAVTSVGPVHGGAAVHDLDSAGTRLLSKVAPSPGAESDELVRVFRVESPGNQRLDISPDGDVTVKGDAMLHLNFGDEARAQEFHAKRIAQGHVDTTIKSFDVPKSYADDVAQRAMPQSGGKGAEIQHVDTTKTSSSYGLRGSELDRLRDAIVPGSGR